MIKIDNGLFHYEIIGEKEQDAAAEFENKLDFISRQYWMHDTADDIGAAKNSIASKYNVEIRVFI